MSALRSAQTIAGGSVPPGSPPGTGGFASAPATQKQSTTHWSATDQWGNVISFTSTIEENLGSTVVVPGRGFLLNNELTDFTALPADPITGVLYANRPEGGKRPRRTAVGDDDQASLGGKRPLSSMTPTLVFKGDKPLMALGSPGGSRITGHVLSVLLAVLDFGMCLGDASHMYRAVGRNTEAYMEEALFNDTETMDALRVRGFNPVLYNTDRPSGFVQAILFEESGGFWANADSRMPLSEAKAY